MNHPVRRASEALESMHRNAGVGEIYEASTGSRKRVQCDGAQYFGRTCIG